MKKLLATLLCAALPALPAFAGTPTADALEQGLAGNWAGALEYRDYQNDRRFQLPMQVQVQQGADGATLTRVSRFDDGPQTGAVYITTVSLFDKTGQRVSSATFRKGRDVEAITEDTRVAQHTDAQHWTVIYQRRGSDDNQPADIRITQTRKGHELSAVKEVKRPDQPDSAYVFRNQSVLVLQP
jgi:hypothetical protein